MAIETKCQTPGAQFHISIQPDQVAITVDLPHSLDLDENQATLLESNIHNAIELVLSRFLLMTDGDDNG